MAGGKTRCERQSRNRMDRRRRWRFLVSERTSRIGAEGGSVEEMDGFWAIARASLRAPRVSCHGGKTRKLFNLIRSSDLEFPRFDNIIFILP